MQWPEFRTCPVVRGGLGGKGGLKVTGQTSGSMWPRCMSGGVRDRGSQERCSSQNAKRGADNVLAWRALGRPQ